MSGSSYRPRPDNGSGDSPRPPFLTEFVNHIREVFFAHAVYHLIGGALARCVPTPIERAFRLKTESAGPVLALHLARAQGGQQSVHACGPNLLSDLGIRCMQLRALRP